MHESEIGYETSTDNRDIHLHSEKLEAKACNHNSISWHTSWNIPSAHNTLHTSFSASTMFSQICWSLTQDKKINTTEWVSLLPFSDSRGIKNSSLPSGRLVPFSLTLPFYLSNVIPVFPPRTASAPADTPETSKPGQWTAALPLLLLGLALLCLPFRFLGWFCLVRGIFFSFNCPPLGSSSATHGPESDAEHRKRRVGSSGRGDARGCEGLEDEGVTVRERDDRRASTPHARGRRRQVHLWQKT